MSCICLRICTHAPRAHGGPQRAPIVGVSPATPFDVERSNLVGANTHGGVF